MAFLNRVRLPFYLRQPQFPQERNVFRGSNGVTRVLSAVVRKTYQGVTDHMTEDLHQKLAIALAHDTVNIEGERYAGGVSLDSDYSLEHIDFLDYPLAPASFSVQVTPFDEANDNCQTCEEATQLNLVDDTIVGDGSDGSTMAMNVFDNDSICCYPIIASVTWFDPVYAVSASISPLGVIEIVLKNPVASVENHKLATYRVTCPNGGYDEADIYGTIVGTDTVCAPPSNIQYLHVPSSEITVESDYLYWDPSPSAPPEYEWQLFECGNGTPIQTGITTDPNVSFSPLDPGGCYILSVRSLCGVDDNSVWVNLEFNIAAPESSCGEFMVYADDGTSNRNAYEFTYMDCLGNLQNRAVVNLSDRRVCMLTDSFNVPIYFEGSEFLTYQYQGPC